jgi:hypothetical protein
MVRTHYGVRLLIQVLKLIYAAIFYPIVLQPYLFYE